MKLRIVKANPAAITPTYATDGSACFDLYATERKVVYRDCPQVFDTGIVFEVPKGYSMLVFGRSGHGIIRNVRLSNAVGVIDSDYRGTVKIGLIADGNIDLEVNPGDRIAQAKLVHAPHIEFEIVDDLSVTDRGAGGLGSTGQ